MKRIFTILSLVVIGLFMAIGTTQATTFDISLTGQVSDAWTFSFDIGSTHYDQGGLSLTLIGDPITVSLGDTINATITLDQPFTVPASVSLTSFIFGLSPETPFSTDVWTSGSTSFFNGIDAGPSGSGSTGSSGWIPNSVVFFPPDNGAFTFDSLTSNFTIDTLSESSVTLKGGTMYYTLFSPAPAPVPEPGTILLLSTGLLGLVFLRRKLL